MANRGRAFGMRGNGAASTVSAAHIAHRHATTARGGLSASEQSVAKRMAKTGSSAHTIRVELGGRYSLAQIEQAIA